MNRGPLRYTLFIDYIIEKIPFKERRIQSFPYFLCCICNFYVEIVELFTKFLSRRKRYGPFYILFIDKISPVLNRVLTFILFKNRGFLHTLFRKFLREVSSTYKISRWIVDPLRYTLFTDVLYWKNSFQGNKDTIFFIFFIPFTRFLVNFEPCCNKYSFVPYSQNSFQKKKDTILFIFFS